MEDRLGRGGPGQGGGDGEGGEDGQGEAHARNISARRDVSSPRRAGEARRIAAAMSGPGLRHRQHGGAWLKTDVPGTGGRPAHAPSR
ncbi:protein translocase subunit secA [Methylobacterium sp. ME121]|nr:protein translocase subunit secA [Methylobacterium sp. ME121]